MKSRTTPHGPGSPLFATAPALDALLSGVMVALTDGPEDQDLPGGTRTLPFFTLLLEDYRARAALKDPPNGFFWSRIAELCPPILEAWEAWKLDPSATTNTAIEHAVMTFWVGFGAFSLDVVTHSLSPATVTTWQGGELPASKADDGSLREQYFALPRLPADIFSQVRAGALRGGNKLGPCSSAFYQGMTFAIPERAERQLRLRINDNYISPSK